MDDQQKRREEEEEVKEAPIRGEVDPGWNDPPPLSYKVTGAKSKEGGALKLNKRVGFPVGATAAANPGPSSSTSATPFPLLHDAGAKSTAASPPPPPPLISVAQTKKENRKIGQIWPDIKRPTQSNPVDVEMIFRRFSRILTKARLEDNVSADVKKRLETLTTSWKKKNLNMYVEEDLIKLVSALESGKADEAERIYINLSVNWPLLCTPWLVGLRHLVADVKGKNSSERKEEAIAHPLQKKPAV